MSLHGQSSPRGRGGKRGQALNFIVGKVMKKTKRKASAAEVHKMLKEIVEMRKI